MPNKHLRLAQAFFAGVALVVLAARSLPPYSYAKDLQVGYLTAWALRQGIDVFTPVSDLSARYFAVVMPTSPRANHLPPVVTLASVPLTLLPFPVVALLWLGLNVALLVAVGRWLGLSTHASLALAAWPPLWWVLDNGNYELVILALAMLGWRAAAAGREWRSGAWLGLAAVLKFYPALLVLPFVVRRQFRIPLAAGLVFAVGQVGSLLTVGPSGFVRYYFEILPMGAGLWKNVGLNSSPHGALLRLFGGAADVEPLIDAPGLVLPLTVALSLLALVALAALKPEAAPLALLVALPNVRGYYAVLALPQIVALLRRPELRVPAFLPAAAASFALPLVNLTLTPILASIHWSGDRAPAVAGLLAAIQPAGYLGLLLLSVALVAEVKASPGCRASLP